MGIHCTPPDIAVVPPIREDFSNSTTWAPSAAAVERARQPGGARSQHHEIGSAFRLVPSSRNDRVISPSLSAVVGMHGWTRPSDARDTGSGDVPVSEYKVTAVTVPYVADPGVHGRM